jgi:hypothetical protein
MLLLLSSKIFLTLVCHKRSSSYNVGSDNRFKFLVQDIHIYSVANILTPHDITHTPVYTVSAVKYVNIIGCIREGWQVKKINFS